MDNQFNSLEMEAKNDLEWFDSMCEILRKENHPTTLQLIKLFGNEKPNPRNEIRGSKFLIPFDTRFTSIAINPDLVENALDEPIQFLSFTGQFFTLKMTDILTRFHDYRSQANIYDGGTQIFFYPVASIYEFSAFDFWVRTEIDEIHSDLDLIFHNITFRFGEKLLLARDGYYMKR
jgi:hypothetical protein